MNLFSLLEERREGSEGVRGREGGREERRRERVREGSWLQSRGWKASCA